jgi:exodeoxyribonuclease V gamma subunit
VVHLYSADRAEPLAKRLAEVLIDDPGDPMEPLWLAVPTEGMRRWLILELARYLGASGPGVGDGVAANFLSARPGTLRQAMLDAGAGIQQDPWVVDRMVWPLLALFHRLSEQGGIPEFTELPEGGSRFTRVRAVADLFDRYHVHRPEMIESWLAGEPVDGSLHPLPAHARWQAELWFLLREVVDTPSPPERMAGLVRRLAEGSLDVDLPPRLCFFGFTTLPGHDFVELVDAAGAHRDVHLFLLEPHRFAPEELRRIRTGMPAGERSLRASDASGALARHPLLRTWGRTPRETAVRLSEGHVWPLVEHEAVDPVPRTVRTSLLGRLQDDIRVNRVSEPSDIDDADRTVQFHACFGAGREVDVARDAILHLLNVPGTDLREEDVLIVCPGLEQFAPLVEAAFGPPASAVDGGGTGSGSGAPRLRYRIADRSMRTANPVLGATSTLLALASGRFELSEVLDFISLAPVRERFGLGDEDLGTMIGWATGTNVRWGLDTGHRAKFGIPDAVRANSWQAALDQLLLGTATADGGLDLAVGGIAPFGVDAGDAEVLGALADIVARLAALTVWSGDGGGAGARPTLASWVGTLRATCRDLLQAPSQAPWQFEALERVFEGLLDDAGPSADDPACGLDLLDVRRLVDVRLDGEPGRPDFFRGGVTVTSMTPLRWVPHRVVCILGLDQEFIGSSAPDAADLVAAAPHLGDPDPRAEGRESLLEAVLAAGEYLVVVRDGRDVRSNHLVPRVVPAAELFDAVLALAPEGDQRTRLGERLEVAHPRHPFDERCLRPGCLVEGVVWSFDPAARRGASLRRTRPPSRPPFLSEGLDVARQEVVSLDDLRTFLSDPVSWFLRRSLEASLPRAADEVALALPVAPSGLELHALGQALLDARAAGVDGAAWRTVQRARGALPPGVLEDRTMEELEGEITLMEAAASARGFLPGAAVPIEVDVLLPDGSHVVGSVPLRLAGGFEGPARIRFTRPKDVHRLEAWLDLMALVAHDPSVPWRSLIVTRAESKKARLKPVDLVPTPSPDGAVDPNGALRDRAVDALAVVVDLFRRGSAEPLPLFAGYSPAQHASGAGDGAWQTFDGRGDATRPAVRLIFGDIDVDDLESIAIRPGDPDPAGGRPPGGRAGLFANHLWGTVGATAQDAP